MELIYIGEKFYRESSTWMSPIYHVTGERSDWGKVSLALEAGESVHIRPAIPSEMKMYEEKLKELKRQQEENGWR